MTTTVGIDLGTTNSAVAIKRLGVSVVKNSEGDALTPSSVTAIAEGKDLEFIVGKTSRDLMKQYPSETVISVKRLMGRDYSDNEVQKIIAEKRHGYKIAASASEQDAIEVELLSQRFSPESISAEILKKLLKDSSASLQATVSQAVVTVPAYFSDKQKFATRKACEKAGVKLLRLLPEPTAAAISFGMLDLPSEHGKTLLVLDLGGGTFDLSLLSVVEGHFMEITKGGDMWLGGDEIDLKLRDLVLERAQKQLGVASIMELSNSLEPAARSKFIVNLKSNCERAKIQLSCENEVVVDSFGELRDVHGKFLDFEVTITRQDFNELLRPVIARLVMITENLLNDVRFSHDLIDEVLMVGGTSQIPAIQAAVQEQFGSSKVKIHERPMVAIAEGAAILAHRLASTDHEESTLNLMHSVTHDYYLQLADGRKHRLAERNSPLPLKAEVPLAFAQTKQNLARLRILNEIDGIMEPVGELWTFDKDTDPFDFTPRKPVERDGRMDLRFEIDENNIIRLEARTAEQVTDGVIVRGSNVLKLFNDLEKTLVEIASYCQAQEELESMVLLSKLIVDNIVNVLDPTTGEVNHELKHRIYQQTKTLIELVKERIDPLLILRRIEGLLTLPAGVVDSENQKKLVELQHSLREQTVALNDFARIEGLVDRWTQLLEQAPELDFIEDMTDLLYSCRMRWPDQATRIVRQFNALAKANSSIDTAAASQAKQELSRIRDDFMPDYATGVAHFNRDVRLV